MDFDLSEEQQLLKTNVRAYLEKEIAPQVDDYERQGPLSREATIGFIKQLMPFGFYNGQMPSAFGGVDMDATTYGVINEELSRVWPGLCGTLWIAGGAAGAPGISESELRELQERVRAGESIRAGAITEPNHGSDSSRLETTATRDGDEWVINGAKSWISNGPICDQITVTVTVDRAAGRAGLRRAFIDTRRSPFEVLRSNTLLGLRGWPNGDLRFDDVRIPHDALTDPREPSRGGGKQVWNFEAPRTMLAVMGVGIAQAAVDASIRYAQERHQFGRPIGAFQLVQNLIVEMVTEVECGRYLTYRAFDLRDKGQDATTAAALAKGYATEMAARVTSKAVEVHGALGLLGGYPIERMFRDARSLSIPDGTTEIQKLVVGRRILGISAIA